MSASFFRQLGAALALMSLACAALATPHVILVQNSGWMEPFYSDPASRFKPLVGALAGAVVQPGDALVLAAFNQSRPGAPSPKALLSMKADGKTVRSRVDAALAGLDTARKPGSAALADTDLGEAVQAAIGTALGGKPGIVWLVTNNRNSPNNDQATAARNREFYELIHRGAAIDKVVAFPLRMPVQGKHYAANGLMVYAFAVGAPGSRALDGLLASGRIASVITERPARLKPLDRDTVRLVPAQVENAPGVAFSQAPGGGLRADVDPDARTPQASIRWNLENTMYPYTIASATLSARSMLAGEDRKIVLASSRVNDLAPGKPLPLGSTMQLPVAQLPDKWSMAAIKSAGSAYVLPGRIELHLADQRLALSQGFRQRMAALFPGDPLPDIFTPPATVQASNAVLPLEVRVHYGMGPLAALGGLAAALLAAGGAAAWAYGRPRVAQLTVEDELRTMRARPGTTQPIYDKAGAQVAMLKTTLFGHQLTDLREGAQVRLGR
ncbi:hypothetical protein [Massilia yuzhufengensis]|uniref:VWFA domain-containing protein n=1 Tax=Massilia yuzhufengensis TaxID=1164594 RepID=A0A1I1ID85_9BURK|nr:hypothetical protein [Massilia yuzhufengensis]SFC33642.1 hypothetical protein SAMN05216204_105158 [Massilia yuzhufengensis]